MATNDFKIIKCPGYTRIYRAEDRNTSGLTATLKAGEAVKLGGTSTNFVTLLISGDPLVDTDVEFVGIVRKTSSETATADGEVEVTTIIPGQTVIRGYAKTAANIDTTSELNALLYKRVFLEVETAKGDATKIDEDQATASTNGLQIIDGNTVDGTLDVIVSGRCTFVAGTRC